ncbi:phosphotransferase enzyme family protein [Alkalihalobacterium bogoriense]|uniref:phosphotransferase enzyme family protein n=1 Tax=Alkalihalobacterium bogoriense TaxID=246272 RepID=UPI00047D9071|nr:phosphotransferase [Alkalihalobacterium bogoriense]
MTKKLQQIQHMINEKYSVHIEKIEQVTNEMYKCKGGQHVYFARVTNYRTLEEQEEELQWTQYLLKEGVGVAPVVLSNDYHQIEQGWLDKEVGIVLFQAAPGIHLPKSKWNAQVFKKVGKEIGKLHRVTLNYEHQYPVTHLKDWFKHEEYQFSKYIPKEETTIHKICADVVQEIQNIPKNQDNYGLIHGDIWLENTLVTRELGVSFIDFQDCEKHFYIYDLVIPIYSALEFSFYGNQNMNDYSKSIWEALLEGYTQEHDIPTNMFCYFPLLFKLKEVFEYNLMHMYWDKTAMTEEQYRILNLYRLRLENEESNNPFDFIPR